MSNSAVVEYQHRPGHFCIGVALRGIYRAAGFDFSEELILGLGSGLCFGYASYLQTRSFDISVIYSPFQNLLFSNTGVRFQTLQQEDNQEAWKRLRCLLDRRRPVAVQINPLYCRSLVDSLDEQWLPFLPAHWVVVTGYDSKQRLVNYYETTSFNMMSMPLSVFMKARNSGTWKQNPHNKWIEVDFPPELIPVEVSVQMALWQTITSMKYLSKYAGYRVGVDGIAAFCRQLKHWNAILTAEQIVSNARQIAISMTLANHVKGAFRLQFARFLEEASGIIHIEDLLLVAEKYRVLSGLWQDLHSFFLQMISNPHNQQLWQHGSAYSLLLDEIRDKESKTVDQLESALLASECLCEKGKI